MSKATKGTILPRKVAQNMAIVGEQIRLARLRRDLSIADIAARATCSELSVMRVEKGSPSVAMGIYLRVLFALQLDDDILHIAQKDEIGRNLQDLDLKQRKRSSKKG
ncbi:MAG: transcriptional regulator [Bacteroidales bacterium]|nr:transcriptional regulator [Bacteroidales bacterium]